MKNIMFILVMFMGGFSVAYAENTGSNTDISITNTVDTYKYPGTNNGTTTTINTGSTYQTDNDLKAASATDNLNVNQSTTERPDIYSGTTE